MRAIWPRSLTVALFRSHFLCKSDTAPLSVHLRFFGQCRAGACDEDRQTDRRAGQGLVLLFSAEAWPGDCWLMQNRNAGVEHLEGGRGRESEGLREWVKAEAEARLMARQRGREMVRKREGWEEGGREGETLSSQCESAGWRSVRVGLRHIAATVNFNQIVQDSAGRPARPPLM